MGTEARRGSMLAKITTDGIELGAVHAGSGFIVIQRADVDDAIAALQVLYAEMVTPTSTILPTGKIILASSSVDGGRVVTLAFEGGQSIEITAGLDGRVATRETHVLAKPLEEFTRRNEGKNEGFLAAPAADPASVLTSRERQTMEGLARGMTNREIAEHLEISIKTVDTHRGHVLKKLGLRNNSELTRFAVKHGYTQI